MYDSYRNTKLMYLGNREDNLLTDRRNIRSEVELEQSNLENAQPSTIMDKEQKLFRISRSRIYSHRPSTQLNFL
jgi:hypothetical protein